MLKCFQANISVSVTLSQIYWYRVYLISNTQFVQQRTDKTFYSTVKYLSSSFSLKTNLMDAYQTEKISKTTKIIKIICLLIFLYSFFLKL